MRGRPGLIADRDGAVYTIEAIIAAFLLASALACVSALSAAPAPGGNDDLALLSSDLLHLLQYADAGPGHPGLAQALSSASAWPEQSAALVAEAGSRLPPGYRCCLITPLGAAGDQPPAGVAACVRPFLAYSAEKGEIVDCRLIVWRPGP